MNKMVYELKLGCNIPMFVPEYLLKIINCFKKTSDNGTKECECFISEGICKARSFCWKLHMLIFDFNSRRIEILLRNEKGE
jgi:hypothetical protein